MKKYILLLSKIILIITFLNIFAWSVFHVHTGGKRLGFLTNYIKFFSKFPSLVVDVFQEMKSPERLRAVDKDFQELNKLDYDVFTLNASYEEGIWVTKLTNLKNDSVLFKWLLEEKDFLYTDRLFSHAEPRSPILLKDTSLIIHNGETFNLYRLDSKSEIIWHNTDVMFHHGINPDHDGNIWACTGDSVQFVQNDIEYWDDFITQVDVNTGKTLFHKSLSQIFIENNLSHLIHGYKNDWLRAGVDPFHLNEVQPALKDGIHWKTGDLFVSLRHRSLIFLYRPSENKIIRMIQGPFYNQHDVDINSDSTISLFNNNVSSLSPLDEATQDELSGGVLPNQFLNIYSEVLTYNFNDSSFNSLYANQFKLNDLFTETQGLHHILSNGDLFVEEWNEGKLFIFKENETILKKYLNVPDNGLIEPVHWVRIYENLDFLN